MTSSTWFSNSLSDGLIIIRGDNYEMGVAGSIYAYAASDDGQAMEITLKLDPINDSLSFVPFLNTWDGYLDVFPEELMSERNWSDITRNWKTSWWETRQVVFGVMPVADIRLITWLIALRSCLVIQPPSWEEPRLRRVTQQMQNSLTGLIREKTRILANIVPVR